MVQVTIRAIVGENRQLHIALPDDFPLGPVIVTITPLSEESSEDDDEITQLPPGGSGASPIIIEERRGGNAEDAMTQVKFKAVLGQARQLIITLPDEMPLGPVEVIVNSVSAAPGSVPGSDLTRDQWRALFAEAGLLSTERYAPPDAVRLTDEELEELGRLPVGAPSTSMLIDEDRGEQWD